MLGLALGAIGSLAAATGASWATMDARAQLYGRTFIGTPGHGRQLALTYDDGPNDRYTIDLLDVLARHSVRATFFMIGKHVAAQPSVAHAVAAAGHEIGNHTWRHPNLIFCSRAQVEAEIKQCAAALEDAVGAHSRLFRPPYGGRRPQVLRTVRALGYQIVMWSVSGRDWTLPTARDITEHMQRRTHGGDVILLHDGSQFANADRGNTVRASDAYIHRMKEEGFEFVTVGQMMEAGSAGAKPK